MTQQQLTKQLKKQYIIVGTTIENKIGDTIVSANNIEDLAKAANEFGLLKQEVFIMYEIIYNGEVIDIAYDTKVACDMVKDYRMAFKSNNVWYREAK